MELTQYIVRKPVFMYTSRTFAFTGMVIPILEVSPVDNPTHRTTRFMGREMRKPKNNYVENHIRLVKEDMRNPQNTSLYDEEWCLKSLVDENGYRYTPESLFELFCTGYYTALHAIQYVEMGYEIYVWYQFLDLKGVPPIQITEDLATGKDDDEYDFLHKFTIDAIKFKYPENGHMNFVGTIVPEFYVVLTGNRHEKHPIKVYLGKNFPKETDSSNLTNTIAMAKKFTTEAEAIDFAIEHDDYLAGGGFHIVHIKRPAYLI